MKTIFMNDALYTLILQHDNFKNIRNWVVRLEAKVDNDGLETLKQYAKDFKGYYASNQGLYEFTFKTAYHAKQYCKRLDECLQETDDSYELDLPDFNIVEDEQHMLTNDKSNGNIKEISLEYFCSSLKSLIGSEGIKILLCDSTFKLVACLKKNDAFKNLPPSIEFILRTIIMKKYSKRLLSIKNWEDECQELINEFVYDTGLNEKLSTVVFECLAYASGKVTQINHILEETSIPQKEQLHQDTRFATNDFNIKDFYHCYYLKQQNLWCIIFEANKFAGNAAFA